MERFSGQTAVVTGGAQGIGFAICKKLASEGAKIWIFDQNVDEARQAVSKLTEMGCQASCCNVDVASEASVQSGFLRLSEAGDTCSVVVNSAGIVGPNGIKTEDVSLEDFERTCRVNLTGSFLMLKHGLKAMLPQKYGRILLIASIAGKEGNAGMCPYSVSKAGVIGLVKVAGKEYAEEGITINAVAPATIMTRMVAGMAPAQVKYMTDKIPMKRCGTVEEIANLAAWIVSPEASFNTGFTFDLTGGRAVY